MTNRRVAKHRTATQLSVGLCGLEPQVARQLDFGLFTGCQTVHFVMAITSGAEDHI
jgi:hypothetical protein